MILQITNIEFVLGNKTETIQDLGKHNPDWIIDKLKDKIGIESRPVIDYNENEKTLVLDACNKLFHNTDKNNVDGIIHVSQSAFSRLPTSACIIQDEIGLPKNLMAFDLIQGCSGFVYGLSAATAMMQQNALKKVLIVCADTYSKYIPSVSYTHLRAHET